MRPIRSVTVVLCAVLGMAALPVFAQPRERIVVRDDDRLWVELGSRTVDFRGERDTIEVGRRDGRFTHVMFKVADGDLILDKIRVTYGDGQVWESDYRAEFREGMRSHAIEIPGGPRTVWRVDFVARSEHRRDPAKIVLFGKEAPGAVRVVPAVVRDDDRLWVELGSRMVDFHTERDTIEVGRRDGRFTHLLFKVEDGDLIVDKIRVTYGDGKVWESDYRAEFREGARSHAIDLPGGAHTVWRVDFVARSEHRRDPAKILLFGKEAR